jgi:OOP family OmpA-OmpF porin
VKLETIIVTGHADRIGSSPYNQRLSARRAQSVKDYLVSKGFDASRIYAEGKGETQPVTGDKCRNMGPESRHNRKLIACLQPDRRVEIELIGTTQ